MSCRSCGCDPEARHTCENYPFCTWGKTEPIPVPEPGMSVRIPPGRVGEFIKSPSCAVLPDDPTARKQTPIASGVLDYFPDAIAEIARVSFQGNEQHNPGQPLHWAREKSTDHADCIGRHLLQRGGRDTDGMRHSAKLAWRALALLQLEIEADRAQTVATTARGGMKL